MTTAVLATVLVPHPAATAAPPTHTPPVAGTHPTVLPPISTCPAYLGPQCDSLQREQYATGQDIAALGLGR